jgi:hypothetical protein
MLDQLRKITAINQGKYESVSNFYEQFKGQADIINHHRTLGQLLTQQIS